MNLLFIVGIFFLINCVRFYYTVLSVYVILKNLESEVISVFAISIKFPNLSDLEIGETRAIFKRLTLLCTAGPKIACFRAQNVH